jgi:hypothetical protein
MGIRTTLVLEPELRRTLDIQAAKSRRTLAQQVHYLIEKEEAEQVSPRLKAMQSIPTTETAS